MTTLSDLPIKQIQCDTCQKKIWSCARCRHCHQKWCKDCAKKQYDCVGPNHHFSEECCEDCVPEYGRIVDEQYRSPTKSDALAPSGRYYCPNCAPPSEVSECKFKNESYIYQDNITRRDRISSGLQRDYLNNPENWKRYETNKEEVEKEWEEMMTHRKARPNDSRSTTYKKK
jgi:hypothetical protein